VRPATPATSATPNPAAGPATRATPATAASPSGGARLEAGANVLGTGGSQIGQVVSVDRAADGTTSVILRTTGGDLRTLPVNAFGVSNGQLGTNWTDAQIAAAPAAQMPSTTPAPAGATPSTSTDAAAPARPATPATRAEPANPAAGVTGATPATPAAPAAAGTPAAEDDENVSGEEAKADKPAKAKPRRDSTEERPRVGKPRY